MKIHTGFTLIELMIVIVVLAIIVTLAVPSFRSIIQNNRAVTISNDLAAALQTARSEALKIRANVTVCRRNTSGDACAADQDWSVGWLLCSGACGSDEIIRVWAPVGGNAGITASPPAGITFRRTGDATVQAQFHVQISGGTVERCVRVNASGRVDQVAGSC